MAVEGPLPEVKVTTDTSGHYEFPHILPEGYYKLTARDPVGGGLARLSVTLKRQEPLVQDVQLEGRGTVRVQVVSGDDEPVESALVKLTETEYPSRSFDQTVRPGNQGRVVFLDVYEGPLRIDVSDPFARSGSATAVLGGPGEEIDVKVEVTPTGRVTGLFLMPDKTRIPYGTVTLKAGGKVVGQTTALGSGDVGRFSFDYVPVGPVTLDAQDPLTARVGFKSGTLDHEGDPPLELDVVAQGLGTRSRDGQARREPPGPGPRRDLVGRLPRDDAQRRLRSVRRERRARGPGDGHRQPRRPRLPGRLQLGRARGRRDERRDRRGAARGRGRSRGTSCPRRRKTARRGASRPRSCGSPWAAPEAGRRRRARGPTAASRSTSSPPGA